MYAFCLADSVDLDGDEGELDYETGELLWPSGRGKVSADQSVRENGNRARKSNREVGGISRLSDRLEGGENVLLGKRMLVQVAGGGGDGGRRVVEVVRTDAPKSKRVKKMPHDITDITIKVETSANVETGNRKIVVEKIDKSAKKNLKDKSKLNNLDDDLEDEVTRMRKRIVEKARKLVENEEKERKREHTNGQAAAKEIKMEKEDSRTARKNKSEECKDADSNGAMAATEIVAPAEDIDNEASKEAPSPPKAAVEQDEDTLDGMQVEETEHILTMQVESEMAPAAGDDALEKLSASPVTVAVDSLQLTVDPMEKAFMEAEVEGLETGDTADHRTSRLSKSTSKSSEKKTSEKSSERSHKRQSHSKSRSGSVADDSQLKPSKSDVRSAKTVSVKSSDKSGNKSDAKSGSMSDARSGNKSDAKGGNKSNAKSANKSGDKSGSKSDANSGSKSDAKRDNKSDDNSGSESDAKGVKRNKCDVQSGMTVTKSGKIDSKCGKTNSDTNKDNEPISTSAEKTKKIVVERQSVTSDVATDRQLLDVAPSSKADKVVTKSKSRSSSKPDLTKKVKSFDLKNKKIDSTETKKISSSSAKLVDEIILPAEKSHKQPDLQTTDKSSKILKNKKSSEVTDKIKKPVQEQKEVDAISKKSAQKLQSTEKIASKSQSSKKVNVKEHESKTRDIPDKKSDRISVSSVVDHSGNNIVVSSKIPQEKTLTKSNQIRTRQPSGLLNVTSQSKTQGKKPNNDSNSEGDDTSSDSDSDASSKSGVSSSGSSDSSSSSDSASDSESEGERKRGRGRPSSESEDDEEEANNRMRNPQKKPKVESPKKSKQKKASIEIEKEREKESDRRIERRGKDTNHGRSRERKSRR